MGRKSSNKNLEITSWSSSAEEIVGNLGLLIDILICLPVKSLIRFTSVNKQWRFLILGKEFISKHIARYPKSIISGLYFKWDNYPIPVQGHSLPTLTFLGKSRNSIITGMDKYKIHDSRRGLIFCSFKSSFRTPRLMVCNPTTQKYKVFLQRELNLRGHVSVSHFYLHFEPSISIIYKLILIRVFGGRYDISICASNCSVWKTISFEAQHAWGCCTRHGVSSNGIIFMITNNWHLIEFNVETEKLTVAHMNLAPNMESLIGYFGECGDDGNLVLIVANKYSPDFRVYEMDRRMEGRDWVLKHIVNPCLEVNNFPETRRPITGNDFAVMRVIWDGEDNDEKDLILVFGILKKAILYNHRSKKTQVISDLQGQNHLDRETTYRNVHPFIGSLCAV